MNPEIGEVILDARSVRDSLAHGGANRYKRAAFKAVKDVIEKGRVVHTNPGEKLTSYFIAAPVEIDGKENIVVALVRQFENSKRFYLHAVGTKEGLLENQVSGGQHAGSRSTSPEDIITILRDIFSVNENYEDTNVRNRGGAKGENASTRERIGAQRGDTAEDGTGGAFSNRMEPGGQGNTGGDAEVPGGNPGASEGAREGDSGAEAATKESNTAIERGIKGDKSVETGGEVSGELSVPINSSQIDSKSSQSKDGQIKRRRRVAAHSIEGHPLYQAIVDYAGGLMSKSAALKKWGREKFERNKSLWDDAPVLSNPRHSSIYNPRGGIAPDQMVEHLKEVGLLRPEDDVPQMWAAIGRMSESGERMAKQIREAEAAHGEEAKEHKEQARRFAMAAFKPEPGEHGVRVSDLSIGDRVTVEGEELRVTHIDPDTEAVTLEDHAKFGVQEVADGRVMYVEDLETEGRPDVDDFLGEGGSPSTLNAGRKLVSSGYEALDEAREDLAWRETVAGHFANPHQRRMLPVGRVPAVLRAVGMSDAQMVMPPSVIDKVTGGKHQLTREMVEQIPAALRDPIFVFDSATVPDAMTVLTEIRHEGQNVLAAIHLDQRDLNQPANVIVSLYEKSPLAVQDWIKSGLLRYANQGKARQYFRTARLQLPREGSKAGNKTLLTEADIVNKDSALKNILDAGGVVAGNAVITPPGENSTFLAASIKAWHGTPHEIDVKEGFRKDKIGSGEGVQAYGWGFYSADDRQTAEGYRGNRGGNLYKLELDVEPEELLVFDGRLSEQPENVQNFIRDFINNLPKELEWAKKGIDADTRGKELYGSLADILPEVLDNETGNKQQLASEYLASKGIKGIKYNDRHSEDGAQNYVIFDPANIKITGKNGQPVSVEQANAEQKGMSFGEQGMLFAGRKAVDPAGGDLFDEAGPSARQRNALKIYNQLMGKKRGGEKLTPGQQTMLERVERELGQGMLFETPQDTSRQRELERQEIEAGQQRRLTGGQIETQQSFLPEPGQQSLFSGRKAVDTVPRRVNPGCVAAGTLIYDPLKGRGVAVEELAADDVNAGHVVAVDSNGGIRASNHGRPFKKGVARLFKVTVEDGRTITVTERHLFLAKDGWKSLAEGLKVGDKLALYNGKEAA